LILSISLGVSVQAHLLKSALPTRTAAVQPSRPAAWSSKSASLPSPEVACGISRWIRSGRWL
jgi:hypothetical protein